LARFNRGAGEKKVIRLWTTERAVMSHAATRQTLSGEGGEGWKKVRRNLTGRDSNLERMCEAEKNGRPWRTVNCIPIPKPSMRPSRATHSLDRETQNIS